MITYSYGKGKALPCTKEKFYEIVRDEKTSELIQECHNIYAQIEAARLANPDVEPKELLEEYKKVKNGLPFFIFQGTFKNNHRAQINVWLNGLFMNDYDHLGDVRQWMEEKMKDTALYADLTAAMERGEIDADSRRAECVKAYCQMLHDKYGVMLVHITPSGRGMRLVAKANVLVGNIADNQNWLSMQLGIDHDEACKDASRGSFAVREEDILFLDEELFTYHNPAYDEQFGDTYREKGDSAPTQTAIISTPATSEAAISVSPNSTSSQSSATTQPSDSIIYRAGTKSNELMYHDVTYHEINREWLTLNGGIPKEGDRNNTLFKMTCAMRHICDHNAQQLFDVLPSFGLSDEEMKTTICSALKRDRTVYMPKNLRNTLESLGIGTTAKEEVEERESVYSKAFEEYGKRFRRLNLPEVFKVITGGVQQNQQIAIILASLPMLYTLESLVRFKHFDGKIYTLSGITFIVGEAASGKSFFLPLDEILMSRLRAESQVGYEADTAFKEASRQAGNGEVKMSIPKRCVRVLQTQTSNSQLANRMRNAQSADGTPLHCYMCDTEISTLVRAEKSGQWQKKRDIIIKSFANEKWGIDYLTEQTISGEVEVFLNLCYTGTEGSFDEYIRETDVNDGLATRIMYTPMPYTKYQMLKPNKGYSETDKAYLTKLAAKLETVNGFVDAQPLTDAMYKWCDKIAKRAEIEEDDQLDTLRKRTALIGIRAGVCFAIVKACKAGNEPINMADVVFDKDAIKFAEFIADYCLTMQYAKFASKMRKQKQREIEISGVREAIKSKNTEIYNHLNRDFSFADVKALRKDASENAIQLMLDKWLRKGFVKRPSKGVYLKTRAKL